MFKLFVLFALVAAAYAAPLLVAGPGVVAPAAVAYSAPAVVPAAAPVAVAAANPLSYTATYASGLAIYG
ncbi:hypothetical protein R5R35_014600 [Gryllus longicercus]